MIHIDGQLAIRTITGRNGKFSVGRLATSIVEFVIKDALLDQYTEGKYRGNFAISETRPSYYSTGGRLVVEIRAKVDSMTLDDVDNLTAVPRSYHPPSPIPWTRSQSALRPQRLLAKPGIPRPPGPPRCRQTMRRSAWTAPA